MIRYAITEAELRQKITKHARKWLTDARAATRVLKHAGSYVDGYEYWGKIKQVYLKLQHKKCGYCERKIAADGTREHDIDHFRPKDGVKEYVDAAGGAPLGFSTGPAEPAGYYLLTLHPLNYLVSCKTCNSDYKQSFFPIAGKRVAGRLRLRSYSGERPYLIHPLVPATDDEPDPDEIITFDGVVPIPAISPQEDEHWHRVGRVTIELLGLEKRDELRKERAEVIRDLYVAILCSQSRDPEAQRSGRRVVKRLTRASARHANCARSFLALYRRAPRKAKKYFNECLKVLE